MMVGARKGSACFQSKAHVRLENFEGGRFVAREEARIGQQSPSGHKPVAPGELVDSLQNAPICPY